MPRLALSLSSSVLWGEKRSSKVVGREAFPITLQDEVKKERERCFVLVFNSLVAFYEKQESEHKGREVFGSWKSESPSR